MEKYFCHATKHLVTCDPAWSELIPRIGPCGLVTKPEREPYEALVRTVAYQQLHVLSAEAILKRFIELFPACAFPSPQQLLAIDDGQLRNSGFSAAKIATIRDIAGKTIEGIVPTRNQALGMSDIELIERLASLRGVGQWTVEMLMIFTLERPDILPVNDFCVRQGWSLLKSLDKQLTPLQMHEIGQHWSPFRTTATWYLWQAVKQAKQQKKEKNAAKKSR